MKLNELAISKYVSYKAQLRCAIYDLGLSQDKWDESNQLWSNLMDFAWVYAEMPFKMFYKNIVVSFSMLNVLTIEDIKYFHEAIKKAYASYFGVEE